MLVTAAVAGHRLGPARRHELEDAVNVRELVGVGDKVGLVAAPVVVLGVIANLAMPELFSVGGPAEPLRLVSIVVLAVGLALWLWSVVLILTKVPHHELISSGPYALVRHPLYTSVALLVLPWAGFLLDTWLGVVIGAVVYLASRMFAPQEEASLATTFGPAWHSYRRSVLIPWI
jgi:protein-S-isoprenylcysteine O-methyltransferase Ste14